MTKATNKLYEILKEQNKEVLRKSLESNKMILNDKNIKELLIYMIDLYWEEDIDIHIDILISALQCNERLNDICDYKNTKIYINDEIKNSEMKNHSSKQIIYQNRLKKLQKLFLEYDANLDIELQNSLNMENIFDEILKEQNLKSLKEYKKQNVEKDINVAECFFKIYSSKKEINIEFFQELLLTGDINTPNSKGFTVALMVGFFGSPELTQLCLNLNIDMNKKVEFMLYGEKEKAWKEPWDFDYLYEINFKDKIVVQVSPFCTAFYNYNSENIKLLIENGANVNEYFYDLDALISRTKKHTYIGGKPSDTSDALEKALAENDTNLVKLLVKYGSNVDLDNNFLSACKHGNFELIKFFLNKGSNINSQNYFGSALSLLCERQSDYIYTDIDLKNSVDHKKELELSKSYKVIDIVKYLIKKGADVNLNSPLMKVINGKDDIVMINNTSDINKGIITVNLELINLLINNGADVNYFKTYTGRSIFMEVCDGLNNKVEIAKIFIKNNVDLNHRDKDKNTALMLIKDLESQKYTEDDPFSTELKKKFPSEKLMELLLDNGVDINAQNKIGLTALMKYAYEGNERLTKILLDRGADITIKSEMTAFLLASNDEIKKEIQKTQNNTPQRLIKLLSNFTIDKPIKFTTHWENDGFLQTEYGDFDAFMDKIKKEFFSIQDELKDMSPNLYKKVYSFLLEENPDSTYTWCSKVHINIGWSSLSGLKEHYNSGNNPYDFKLKEYICIKKGIHKETFTTFGDLINLFKQEIEIRIDFKNLETIFSKIQSDIANNFNFDIKYSKLQRQFYTDTEMFNNAIEKIFAEIKKRKDYTDIELTTKELDDRSLEIRIMQKDSKSNISSVDLLNEVESGDFATIKGYLTNLCDWSVESSCEDGDFRINYLHSNNVKEIINIKEKIDGFTHILRFYR